MRSILFKPFMYEQTVNGNKNETRRLHGLKEINESPNDWQLSKVEIIIDRLYAVFTNDKRTFGGVRMIPAKYRIGEELYLAEPHYLRTQEPDAGFSTPILYADDPIVSHMRENEPGRFGKIYEKISPMFLQQKYAREFIKITGFSIERAHDITEEAAKREGITDLNYGIGGHTCYRASYAATWDEINKKMPWAMNPWLFVYHYEYLKAKSKRVA